MNGVVPAGGDLDLLVVTDRSPGDDWFRELHVDGLAVEIFARGDRSLNDVDEILRHQSLPFELVENLHLEDPHGILGRAREAVRPRLLDPAFVVARAEASLGGAREAVDRACSLLEEEAFDEAARHLSIAFWHGAAAAACAAAMKPTTRRCLVVWAEAITKVGVREQLDLLADSIGPCLDRRELERLADVLAAGDDRVAGAVAGMIDAHYELSLEIRLWFDDSDLVAWTWLRTRLDGLRRASAGHHHRPPTRGACCLAWPDEVSHAGLLEPISTHPAHQNRGLARAVTADALKALRDAGALTAQVGTSGPAARAAYIAAGFRPWKREVTFRKRVSRG